MIYLTGDLHGGETSWHVKKAGCRGDIIICLGDLGGVWYHDYHINGKHKRQENGFLEMTLRPSITWLAVDGNHENFDRLFCGEFTLVDIYGGKAYKIKEHVYYLKRGEIFTIEGHTFLAFGGARSNDKEPGTVTDAYGRLKRWKGRTESKNWWPQEVPSEEDFENACRNLDQVEWNVDYVVTHTCPESKRNDFLQAPRPPDPTEAMLQAIYEKLTFKEWHFGHFHTNEQAGKFICHYDKVQPLNRL